MTTTEEHELRELIHSAMVGVAADPTGLQRRARAEGMRLRRRRRLAGGVAASVLGVAAAMVLPLALPGDDRARDSDVVATQPPTAPQGSASSARPLLDPDWQGWWTMPASRMGDTLGGLLPEGMELTDLETRNTDRALDEASAELQGFLVGVLRPAEGGPGKINVAFQHPPAEADTDGNVERHLEEQSHEDLLSCAPDARSPGAWCRVSRDTSGTPVARLMRHTVNGVTMRSVDVAAADGVVVHVSVANTLDAKYPEGATPSAAAPPLTLRQLLAIARHPDWQRMP